MATRLGPPLTHKEMYFGLCATLVEDSFEALREALARQREIEETL